MFGLSNKRIDSTIGQLQRDPNFFMILVGALIWLAGSYNLLLLAPLLLPIGLGLVCTAAAITSLQRPTENAVFGLLLGGLLQVVGYILRGIFLVSLIAPLFTVSGAVLIIFFAIPLAIQSGRVPFVEEMQKSIKAQRHKREKPAKTDADEKKDEDDVSE